MDFIEAIKVCIFFAVLMLGLSFVIRKLDSRRFQQQKNVVNYLNFDRKSLKTLITRLISNVFGDEFYKKIKILLIRAGYEHKSPESIYGISLTSAVFFAIFCALFFGKFLGVFTIFVSLIIGVVGLLLPKVFLEFRSDARKKKIQSSVLGYVEILYTTLEAGVSTIDSAIIRIYKIAKSPLALEFKRTWSSFEKSSREEAINEMIDRCNCDDVRLLLEAIQQSIEKGTPIVKILQDQAQRIRASTESRLIAEGQKKVLYLMIPIFIFLFPAVFLIILTPAFLKIFEIFGGQAFQGF